MLKKILPLIILCATNICFGQSAKFPNGVYLNQEQLKTHTPAYDANLEILKRTSGDIFMMGGNDYKIKSHIDSINKSYITKKMVAYVRNDSVFLNCVPYKLQTWYTLCIGTIGNYITFKACMSFERAKKIALYGGGLGSGAAAAKRYLYVLNLTTGKVDELTEKTMLELLKDKPELLLKYKENTDRESEDRIMEFINLLNQN